jgi:hypothetical protein
MLVSIFWRSNQVSCRIGPALLRKSPLTPALSHKWGEGTQGVLLRKGLLTHTLSHKWGEGSEG